VCQIFLWIRHHLECFKSDLARIDACMQHAEPAQSFRDIKVVNLSPIPLHIQESRAREREFPDYEAKFKGE
jgi:hypothetical protein